MPYVRTPDERNMYYEALECLQMLCEARGYSFPAMMEATVECLLAIDRHEARREPTEVSPTAYGEGPAGILLDWVRQRVAQPWPAAPVGSPGAEPGSGVATAQPGEPTGQIPPDPVAGPGQAVAGGPGDTRARGNSQLASPGHLRQPSGDTLSRGYIDRPRPLTYRLAASDPDLLLAVCDTLNPEILARWRRASGIKAEELSRLLRVTPGVVSGIEARKRNFTEYHGNKLRVLHGEIVKLIRLAEAGRLPEEWPPRDDVDSHAVSAG